MPGRATAKSGWSSESKESDAMIQRVDGVVIVDVSGELTLRDKVMEAMESGCPRIILNMATMTRIDAFGLGELVGAYASILKAGGEMKLLRVSPKVKRMLEITLLSTVFEMHEDEVSAVSSFTKPGTEVFIG